MHHFVKSICSIIIVLTVFTSCDSTKQSQQVEKRIDFVDPFIGTTREGNQLPGPRVPFGMVQPNIINVGPEKPSATNYKFGEPKTYGIALTNMVGVGCGNFGSIVVKPTVGLPDFENYESDYANEKSKVGYYSVDLLRDSIQLEMTTATRSSLFKLHYPKGKANLFFDLSRRAPTDTSFMIQKISDNEIEGYKTDGSFCSAGDDYLHKVYFVAQTDIQSQSSGTVDQGQLTENNQATGEDIGAYFSYNFEKETTLTLKVGISYVSIENARENLEKEIGAKSFETVQQECEAQWEEMLSRIAVEDTNTKYKTMFYTALYHTMSHPNILEDINGEYPAMGSHEVKKVKEGQHRFTVFSLWDTYRTLHPFFTLAYPEIQYQMSASIMDMYYENGWLPQWELIGKETFVMVGDPATIVLTDSYLKGLDFANGDSILKATIHNAEEYYDMKQWGYDDVAHIRRSIVPYKENNGWIPYDVKDGGNNRHWATVATTQEYNLADWNIAQLAQKQGQKEVSDKYLERSKGYQNLYNPETGFFQQRWKNKEWLASFDPYAGRWPPIKESDKVYDMPWPYSGGPGYCEGMSWHYNFFVPHDMQGVIELMGGEENFTNRLQLLFDSSRYEATNEPDLAYPFLFNYVKGEEWRTQKIVNHLINHEYGIGTDGIPGNDDTGTMSAWLLFAMMGIYPDCPGDLNYQVCSPVFDKVTIKLNSNYYKGEQLVIETDKNSNSATYISSIELNGEAQAAYTLHHSDLTKGGIVKVSLKDKQ